MFFFLIMIFSCLVFYLVTLSFNPCSADGDEAAEECLGGRIAPGQQVVRARFRGNSQGGPQWGGRSPPLFFFAVPQV